MRPKCTLLDTGEMLALGKFPSVGDERILPLARWQDRHAKSQLCFGDGSDINRRAVLLR